MKLSLFIGRCDLINMRQDSYLKTKHVEQYAGTSIRATLRACRCVFIRACACIYAYVTSFQYFGHPVWALPL